MLQGHVECNIIEHFGSFCQNFVLLSPKKGKKTCIFLQKWLDHLLLMTSYLVTTPSDSHQSCQKVAKGYSYSYGNRQL